MPNSPLTANETKDYLLTWKFAKETPWLTTNFERGEFTFCIIIEVDRNGASQLKIAGNTGARNEIRKDRLSDHKAKWKALNTSMAQRTYYVSPMALHKSVKLMSVLVTRYWDGSRPREMSPGDPKAILTAYDFEAKWAYFVHLISEYIHHEI
jgi:hypothetical protein